MSTNLSPTTCDCPCHDEQNLSSHTPADCVCAHQHEWWHGECQTCGATHPEDCAGCDPHVDTTPEHTYEPPTCADCGEYGERTGHMECQYPQNHEAL